MQSACQNQENRAPPNITGTYSTCNQNSELPLDESGDSEWLQCTGSDFFADWSKATTVCLRHVCCVIGVTAQAQTLNILRTVLMVATGLEAFGCRRTGPSFMVTLVTTLHLFHQPEFPPSPANRHLSCPSGSPRPLASLQPPDTLSLSQALAWASMGKQTIVC